MFLVFTDVFTKYTITIPTRDQTAKTVSRLFVREWIKKLGVPERIHSNQRIISYLRRYVKGFAKIAKPLNGLLG